MPARSPERGVLRQLLLVLEHIFHAVILAAFGAMLGLQVIVLTSTEIRVGGAVDAVSPR